MKKNILLGICVLATLIVECQVGITQPKENAYQRIDRIAEKMKRYKGYDWKTAPWTEDNTPYRRMRVYIDKFIAQGHNPIGLKKISSVGVQGCI